MDNICNKIKETIDASFEADSAEEADGLRNHLGFSILGRKCPREIYYPWRWALNVIHKGRILRIFQRGHDTEPKMVGWLERAGFTIQNVDPATGKQYLASFLGGFFGGSADGIITGVPSWFSVPNLDDPGPGVFECKSHNTKSFCNMLQKGLVTAKPDHYAQMQCYMASFGCKWGLYCALNKNDEDIYFEIVPFQSAVAEALFEKAKDIALRTTPPKRISQDPNWYECKFCDYNSICHLNRLPHKTCRSCIFIQPRVKDGKSEWYCSHFGTAVPPEWLKKGCGNWKNGL